LDLEGGDEPPAEEEMDPMAQIAAFLTQIPPNWELAELHSKANLVVNSSSMQLNFEDKSSFCQCCQLPIPKEENMYPICVDNTQLGDLGPGFPLFFIFMKYLAWFCFFLTIFYFLPAMFMINAALMELKSKLGPEDSQFALFSLGALIHHVGDVGYDNLDIKKRQEFLNLYGAIFFFNIIFSAFFLAWIKTKLFQKINELDQSAFTPSDFCVMGSNIDFGDDQYSPEELKKCLVEYFNDYYVGLGSEIVYVNPAYKIGDFYKVSTRYAEVSKLKVILEAY
jgi:hypothetical protein